MELQMILCHRAVGSMKQNVLKDSEAAFHSLARILLSWPPGDFDPEFLQNSASHSHPAMFLRLACLK